MSGEPAVDARTASLLAATAEQVAREAGEFVRRTTPPQVAVLQTKSSPTDVVTEMDNAVEALLRERLAELRPEDGVLGEEGASVHGRSGVTWVLDPIDGTVNYLYGIDSYAVSVAAVLGDVTVPGAWTPVAGCVHRPVGGQTWTAAAGGGASLDGARLSIRPAPALARALVGTGFGYRQSRRRAQARVVAELLPQIRDVRRIGSASVDLCMVADGRLDAYYERGLNAWDMAAAMLVVREAGGEVSGLDGAPAGPDMVVAAAPGLREELAGLLSGLGAADPDD